MEEPDIVWETVRAAVTDSGQEIGGQMSPGVANLFELLNLTGAQPDVIQLFTEQRATGNIRYGDLKKAVHENIVQALAPIQQRRFAMSDAAISGILAEGAARASKIARATMVDVRSHVGVGRPQIS